MSKNIKMDWTELANLTDSQVSMIGWNKELPVIGDTKDLSFVFGYVGTSVQMELVGINHDIMENGKPAHLSFLCKDVCFEYEMSKADTNEGGWEMTDLRRFLNEIIFNALPEKLRYVIAPIKKISDTGYTGGESTTTVDKLWIPSYDEVGLSGDIIIGKQGCTYPVFTSNASRIKRLHGKPLDYWLRSSVSTTDWDFWNVYHTGAATTGGETHYKNGVVFGFCL